jgi:hypothetical protein
MADTVLGATCIALICAARCFDIFRAARSLLSARRLRKADSDNRWDVLDAAP